MNSGTDLPPSGFGLASCQQTSCPLKPVRACALVSLAILPVLSAPCLLAQTGHRAGANLRISVNLVEVVFPSSMDQQGRAWRASPLAGPSEGVVLDSPPGSPSLSWAEEVKKLSETGWKSMPLAVLSRSPETGGGNGAEARAVAVTEPGSSEPIVRTRIVVQQ